MEVVRYIFQEVFQPESGTPIFGIVVLVVCVISLVCIISILLYAPTGEVSEREVREKIFMDKRKRKKRKR